MKLTPTIDDILHSIEFELAQGAIRRDELGAGVQAVREFQNKARTTLFEAPGAADVRALINQQLQINDMHLTLLQEMAAALQSLTLDVRRVGQLPPRVVHVPAAPTATQETSLVSSEPAAAPAFEEWAGDDGPIGFNSEPIEQAMRPDALKLKPDVRASTLPLIGGLIRRFRAAFHNLTLFYLDQLARKQAAINQVYGERLNQLSQLAALQQQEISALRAQLTALQRKPDA